MERKFIKYNDYKHLSMLSKKSVTENLQKIQEDVENLKKEMAEIEKKQNDLSKILEELEAKISFLNVLSAKINTTYYHITYDIDDKLKAFLSEIKDNLESIVSEINEKLDENKQNLETVQKRKK